MSNKAEPKFVLKKRIPKVKPIPENYQPEPYVHPMEEMLDPQSVDNTIGAICGLLRLLSIETTGKSLNRDQTPPLLELAKLLVEEIRNAAAKENAPIENLPAFALEYFKWRLAK